VSRKLSAVVLTRLPARLESGMSESSESRPALTEVRIFYCVTGIPRQASRRAAAVSRKPLALSRSLPLDIRPDSGRITQ